MMRIKVIIWNFLVLLKEVIFDNNQDKILSSTGHSRQQLGPFLKCANGVPFLLHFIYVYISSYHINKILSLFVRSSKQHYNKSSKNISL